MSLSDELSTLGWSRIGLDDFGYLSLDDFGELPLGTSPPQTPWHIKTVTSSDNPQKSKGEWKIKTVYGEQN